MADPNTICVVCGCTPSKGELHKPGCEREKEPWNLEQAFTVWADNEFGKASDPGIPQIQRYASYFQCFKAGYNSWCHTVPDKGL